MSLTPHPTGRYAYLPAGSAYSAGVIAQTGYEVVWTRLSAPSPLAHGIRQAAALATEQAGDATALCAFALRNVEPLTSDDFARFNEHYRQLLDRFGIVPLGGDNPMARTNVVAHRLAVDEPMVYAFAYARATEDAARPTFVVSGAAELSRDDDGVVAGVVRPGDTSPEAMVEKTATVLDEMQRRLHRLGVDWSMVTTTDLYTVHDPWPALEELLRRIGPAAVHGLQWIPSRPPISGLDVEMDLRGIGVEHTVAVDATGD